MSEDRRRCAAAPAACVLLLLVAAALPVAAAAQTVRAAVDCGRARLDGAERAICASPELARLAARVDSLTARLEASLTGRDRQALVDTERPFVRTRNDCQNAGPDVRACVERVLRHRLDALAAAGAAPDSIQAEVSQYALLDVGYLLRWGDRLEGRRVRVWGRMTLAPGPAATSRVHGALHDDPPRPGARSVSVVFASMTAMRATGFYDAKQPSAFWEGTVERRDGWLVLAGVAP